MLFLALALACAHRSPANAPAPPPAEPDPEAVEAEARARCEAGEIGPCIVLAELLETRSSSPARVREAIDLLTPLAPRSAESAQALVLIAGAHPEVSRPDERVAAWRQLCDGHGMAAACEVGGPAVLPEDPGAAAGLWARGCELGMAHLCPPAAVDANVPVEMPEDFKAGLAALGATFRMPAGFHPVPVAESHDFQTEFAIRSDDGRFEVRYALRDDTALHDMVSGCRDQPGCVSADFTNIQTSMSVVTLANIGHTSPDQVPLGGLPPLGVRVEFNAHWGTVGSIQANPGFAEGSPLVTMLQLHRDPAANLYVVMLLNDPSASEDRQVEAFHSLRFATPPGLGGGWLQ